MPQVNTNFTPSKIEQWKRNPAVAKCYEKLFKKVSPNTSETFMARIIDRVWRDKKKESKVKIAYAIAICETFLNLNHQNIQMSEKIMKPKIVANLVSF